MHLVFCKLLICYGQLVCFHFQIQLVMFSNDITMTHYDVITILFLFRFVANVQDF